MDDAEKVRFAGLLIRRTTVEVDRLGIADGRIGEPYRRGRADEDSLCGVMYERATHGRGPFELTASLTWEVYWTGSQTDGRNQLPSGVFETTHEITVRESQAVVR